jgi:hypothetical protein
MDLLTNNEINNGRGLQLIRNQALSVLEMLERKAYHAIEQAKNQMFAHARFEAFLDITDSRDREWPEQNILQLIKMFTNDNFYQYLVEMCASSLGPLRHFIKQECERDPDDPNPNMSIIPAAAKTRLFACAELSIMLICPSRYTPQVFDQSLQAAVDLQEVGGRSAVLEIPLAQ